MAGNSILYVGAGSLAHQVAALLPQWHGWALRRTSGSLPQGLQQVLADVTSPVCPEDWPQACPDYVLITLVPAARTVEAYRQAYVEGVRNVLAWLQQHGQRPKRILFASSVGVYGQSDGQWVDEQSVTEPERWSGQVMLEAEQLLVDSGLPVTLVRLAGIYGGARRGFLERVRRGYHVGGNLNRYTNRIHEADVAGLLAHLLQLDAAGTPLAPVYVGVDDEPVEQDEVVRWLQQQMDVSGDPQLLLNPAGSSKRCSNRLARSTGWAPRYAGYRDGYAEMI